MLIFLYYSFFNGNMFNTNIDFQFIGNTNFENMHQNTYFYLQKIVKMQKEKSLVIPM